jgi:hypothetical protein
MEKTLAASFDSPTELRRLAADELLAPTHHLSFLLNAGYFKAAKHHLLWSEWSWAQSHTGDQEGFSRLPELARPEIPPFWTRNSVAGVLLGGR